MNAPPSSIFVTRGRSAHRRLTGRGIRLAAAVLLAGLLAGCGPAMLVGTVGSLLLGGGGGGSAASNSGPFSGAPHPVQNAQPSMPGSEALSTVVDQKILDSCREKLPDPPEPLPTAGCRTRTSCLPGMSEPMQLRVCALPSQKTVPVSAPGATAQEES